MSNDEIRFRASSEPAFRLQDFMDEVEQKMLEAMLIPKDHRIFTSTPKRERNVIFQEIKLQNRRARRGQICDELL